MEFSPVQDSSPPRSKTPEPLPLSEEELREARFPQIAALLGGEIADPFTFDSWTWGHKYVMDVSKGGSFQMFCGFPG